MTPILLILLACCGPSMPVWDSTLGAAQISPTETTPPATRGGEEMTAATISFRHYSGEVVVYHPLSVFSEPSPGLYELRCEVDTSENCWWIHGKRWVDYPCSKAGKIEPLRGGYILGGVVTEVCAVLHGGYVPDSTQVCDPTIDTTCVWVRHECKWRLKR